MRLAFLRLCRVLTAILASAFMTSAVPLRAEVDVPTGGEQGREAREGERDHYPPTFLSTPSNVSFPSGAEAVLQCAIENRGTRTVVWRRASDPNPLTIGLDTFVGDTRFSVRHRKHSMEWNLHIQRARSEDSGVYECQVITKARDIRQMILLYVDDTQFVPTFKPGVPSRAEIVTDHDSLWSGVSKNIQIMGSQFVEKGNTLTLTCNATGFDYPPDELDWFKDGLKLVNSRRLLLSKDVSLSEKTIVSKLQVSRATMADAGTYVCRASDRQVTSAKVNVLNTDTMNEKRDEWAIDRERAVTKSGDIGARDMQAERVRDSSNLSTHGFFGNTASGLAPLLGPCLSTLLTSLFIYLVTS